VLRTEAQTEDLLVLAGSIIGQEGVLSLERYEGS